MLIDGQAASKQLKEKFTSAHEEKYQRMIAETQKRKEYEQQLRDQADKEKKDKEEKRLKIAKMQEEDRNIKNQQR